MVRYLLKAVDLQRVGGVVAFQRHDGPQRAQLILGELFVSRLVSGLERRPQFAQAPAAVPGAILDRPDSRVASTWAAKLLVRRAIFYKEVAEVLATISQGSPPVVT